MHQGLTHGSLFTGIGGFELGLGEAGFETRWSSEVEKYCNRVLSERFPEVPNLGDVTELRNAPAVDVLSFGSPCQDLSVAGKRAGLAGARSGLFFEACRVIDECKPAFAVWENVPGGFTSNAGLDFRAVLVALGQLGCRSIAWRVFDSQYFGVPQQRRRVYLVADFGGDRAGEILFDPEGCSGHPSPFGLPGQGLTGTLAAGASRSGRPGGSHDTDLGVSPTLRSGPPPGGPGPGKVNGSDRGPFVVETSHAMTWAKGTGGPAGDEVQNLAPPYLIQDARPGGGTKSQNGEGVRHVRLAYTLDTLNTQAVAFLPRHYTRGKDGAPSTQVPALTADSDRGDGQAVVFDPQQITSPDNRSQGLEGAPYSLNAKGTMSVFQPRVARNGRGRPREDVAGPLTAQAGADGRGDSAQYITGRGRIRRFTPLEYERLQGFPDGHTCLCGVSNDYRTILRVVWNAAFTQGLSERESRDALHMAAETVLQLHMRSAPTGVNGDADRGRWSETCAATLSSVGLPALRDFDEAYRQASQGREYPQQRPGERDLALRRLSHSGTLANGQPFGTSSDADDWAARSAYWQDCRLPGGMMEQCKCPDGPRYRAIGNAVTTTVPRWIGRRIMEVLYA